MPRNHKRWKYWKESIKHFIDNEKVEHLKRFFFFLVQEVPFVKDQTEGNVEPKDQWGYEEECLTLIDKLCGDGDHTLAKKILLSHYKVVSDYTRPLVRAVPMGLHNLVHLLAPVLTNVGIDLNNSLPNLGGIKKSRYTLNTPTATRNYQNDVLAHIALRNEYNGPIMILLARSFKMEHILEMLKYFLDLGLDINVKDHYGYTFLHWLSQSSRIEEKLSDFLVSQEILDINATDNCENYPTFYLNWIEGPIVGRSPLFIAIMYSSDEWIQALLDREDIDIHLITHRGDTAIHCACREGRLNVVKMLLGMDATLIHSRLQPTGNLYCQNQGETLLHTVIQSGRKYSRPKECEEVLEFLLTKIDVNITDDYGGTPLHYYCLHGVNYSGNMLEILLKQPNINVNATMTYTNGFLPTTMTWGLMTPLHLCCERVAENSSKIAMSLLQRDDIDSHAVNDVGQIPLDVAKAIPKSKHWTHPSKGYSVWEANYDDFGSYICNMDLVHLLEEEDFIKNFINLDNLFE